MAKTYCQVAGILLIVVGVLGLLGLNIPRLLSLNEPAEVALHLVVGVLAAAAGFYGGYGRFALLYAQVFGIVYLVLGAIGFVVPDPGLGIHLYVGCNVVHLALGVWGIWAGYLAGSSQASAAPA